MKNVKIVYQYDGSKFDGFQRQKKGKTVQGEIENILLQSFSEKINNFFLQITSLGEDFT